MSEEVYSHSSEPFHAKRVDLRALADTLDQKGQHEQAAQFRARAEELEKHPDVDVQSRKKILDQGAQEARQIIDAAAKKPPYIQDPELKPTRISNEELARLRQGLTEPSRQNKPSSPTSAPKGQTSSGGK